MSEEDDDDDNNNWLMSSHRSPHCTMCSLYFKPVSKMAQYDYPARAVTGRRCPHSSEEGKDFLTGQSDFFTETAVTPKRKVEKLFPRWEINRHVEG